jgi:hypothetical protein
VIVIRGVLMNLLRPVRLALAKRPWIHWLVVSALAAAVGLGVHTRLAAVDRAREEWGDRRTVWVAAQDVAPGEPLDVVRRTLPLGAVPPRAVDDVEPGIIARQHVTAGEPITAVDLVLGVGPAAAADEGSVVVPVSDPFVSSAPVGVRVAIYAEGLVLAPSARIVAVDGDVVFVAVDEADGPIVAAAAQLRTASIVFTR